MQLTQSGNAIVNDARIYGFGANSTGIKIDPGATASFAPRLSNIYITGGGAGTEMGTGINLVGNCIGPVITNPVIEYCAVGIRASDILNVAVIGEDMEGNLDDYVGVDAIFHRTGPQSTNAGHALTWAGTPETYRQFMWLAGPTVTAAGGASTNTTRTPAAPDTWEALLLEDPMLSPYVNPNPGGGATDSIAIITAGLYELRYEATWATASAAAGWGAIRLRRNGTEIPGSFSDCYVPAVSGAGGQCSRAVIVECAAGDTLTIQFNASTTQLRIAGRLGGNGAAPTSATGATWTVRHLGATGVATL